MQKGKLICLIGVVIAFAGCVQETRLQTVHYKLHVSGIKVESAGIRGNDDPLDWDKDLALNTLVPDSLFEATVTYNTGLRFTKVKFLVNGKWELEGTDSRRVNFVEGDTTMYEAAFDTQKP
jgi:putative oxidoreductase